jgi:hypothetical protein
VLLACLLLFSVADNSFNGPKDIRQIVTLSNHAARAGKAADVLGERVSSRGRSGRSAVRERRRHVDQDCAAEGERVSGEGHVSWVASKACEMKTQQSPVGFCAALGALRLRAHGRSDLFVRRPWSRHTMSACRDAEMVVPKSSWTR